MAVRIPARCVLAIGNTFGIQPTGWGDCGVGIQALHRHRLILVLLMACEILLNFQAHV